MWGIVFAQTAIIVFQLVVHTYDQQQVIAAQKQTAAAQEQTKAAQEQVKAAIADFNSLNSSFEIMKQANDKNRHSVLGCIASLQSTTASLSRLVAAVRR